MFVTDFAGTVYSANLDGSNQKTLLVAEGNLTGIAYAELPAAHVPRRRFHRSPWQTHDNAKRFVPEGDRR